MVFRSASAYLSGDSINPPAQPLIGDYSWLLLTPVTGQLGGDSLFHRQSSYDIDKASCKPHYLKIFSCAIRLKPSSHRLATVLPIHLEQSKAKPSPLSSRKDELTVEQVDKRTLALRQEGKTETNKNP